MKSHLYAVSPIQAQDIYVSHHALNRLRIHYPQIGVRGTRGILAEADEVQGAFIAPFLGRSLEGARDRYLVTRERRGVIVIARSRIRGAFLWTAVTYIRFGAYQQSVALRLLEAT